MVNSTTRRKPEEYLRIYLQDHRSAADGGLRLARRCRDSNGDSELGFLDSLVDEVNQDAATLDDIMKRFGVRRNPIKHALVVISERVASLKPNGQFRGYSPLSRVIELEGLISGVHAKQRLWNGLDAAGHGVAPGVLDEMVERANRQLHSLEAFHRTAAAEAFSNPVGPNPSSDPRVVPSR